MTIFCSYMRYTPEALGKIIKNKEDRTIVARKAIESAGGKYIGMWGMFGQKHHIMIVSEATDTKTYLSVIMKVMQGGSIEDIKTVTLYSGADVVAAATMAASDVSYAPVS